MFITTEWLQMIWSHFIGIEFPSLNIIFHFFFQNHMTLSLKILWHENFSISNIFKFWRNFKVRILNLKEYLHNLNKNVFYIYLTILKPFFISFKFFNQYRSGQKINFPYYSDSFLIYDYAFTKYWKRVI